MSLFCFVRLASLLCATFVVFWSTNAQAQSRFGAEVALDVSVFPDQPQFEGQLETAQVSGYVKGEWEWRSKDEKHELLVQPFFRLDAEDSRRTHFDLREAYYRYSGDKGFSLLVGVSKVFWGTTEARHLVDIVNQTDLVEDADEEDKLGQPMINLTIQKPWGTLDLFVLSGFRERTFPGTDGRFRFALPLDADLSLFERSAERSGVDFAARYSHYIGNWDFGISAFYGTSREARFGADTSSTTLIPIYDKIGQFGLDAQYTSGALLFKSENIFRWSEDYQFFATVVGIEYSFFDIFGSGWDIGLISEYLYDGRDDELISDTFEFETPTPVTVFDNDIFYGTRLALNDTADTSLLVGVLTDINDRSSAISVEAETRIAPKWTLDLEASVFLSVDSDNILFSSKQDSNFRITLTHFF